MQRLQRLCRDGLCLGWLAVSPHAVGQDLPPPPVADAAQEREALLHLELVLNQRPTGRVVSVTRRGGHLLVTPEAFGAIRLPERLASMEHLDLTHLEEVEAHYDAPRQRLEVTVPTAWLPRQQLGGRQAGASSEALSSPGALVNYDLHVSKARQGTTRASLWHEARLFGLGGSWRSSGAWREALESMPDGSSDESAYVRYDTTWRHDDQQRLLSYEAGDVVTRPLSWTRAVRLGGVQVSRDFAIRPDLITYPLPSFSGDAEVPTTLDLFVNGNRVERRDIEPGPFTLSDVPSINGAGEATLVTEDIQGRREVRTLPFYVTNELLRPGLASFSIAAGALRRGYGQRSFDYDEAAASVSQRIGVTDQLSLGGHAELADSLALGGAGVTLGLWRAGTLEMAYQYSDSEFGTAAANSLGYQYRGRNVSLGARHERREAGFADLSDVLARQIPEHARTRTQVTASTSLGRWGSMAAGYFEVDDGVSTRLLNLSYQRPLWRNAHLSLSANREMGGAGGWGGLLQVTLALDHGRGVVSAGMERDAEGNAAQQLQYSRAAPLEGGWGWNLGVRHREGQAVYRQADVRHRGERASWRLGLQGAGEDDTYFGGLSGSAVFMAGRSFLANEVNDSFVVVSTDGEAGVPVRYENQTVGHTDEDGYLLVPWGTAYYPGKYEIDPLELPVEVATPEVERRVAVEPRSGYLLSFDLPRRTSASLRLVDADGKDLPLGAKVRSSSGERAVVGWDGMTYLETVSTGMRLRVTLPDGSECLAPLSLPDEVSGRLDLASVTCRMEET